MERHPPVGRIDRAVCVAVRDYDHGYISRLAGLTVDFADNRQLTLTLVQLISYTFLGESPGQVQTNGQVREVRVIYEGLLISSHSFLCIK